MSDHLTKARGALEEARNHDAGSVTWTDLLGVARVQAEVAQADALERIAAALEKLGTPRRPLYVGRLA